MKKPHLIIGAAVAVAAIGVGIYFATRPPQKPPATPGSGEAMVPANGRDKPVDWKAEAKERKSTYYVKPKPEDVPLPMQGFYEWPQTRRLNEVTKYMQERDLNPEMLAFYRAELYNRSNWDVTRNNMANALVWQHKPDPELHKVFIKMLNDENEDPVWRDYCLQFLSTHLPYSSEPELVKQIIAKESHGKGDRAGTAIVHMAIQEAEGRVNLYEEFSRQTSEQLKDPEVTDITKLSILAVAGKRKDSRMLPLVREYAAQSKNDALKRAAIGALGLMGTEDDIPLVEAALNHKNRSIVMAAKPALERLKNAAAQAGRVE